MPIANEKGLRLRSGSPTLGRRGRGAVSLVALATLSLVIPGCVVPQPAPDEVANIGFGDPQSTYETFATAHQGGLLALEYECLSMGLRRRHQLSQHAFREFREQWLREEPRLSWALYRSRIEEVMPLGPRRALVRARVELPPFLGLFMDDISVVAELVLEDSVEVLAGNRTLVAQGAPPEEFGLLDSGILSTDDGGTELQIRIRLPRALELGELGQITTVELRSRWRIDALQVGSVRID